jgi:hypothetical protein
MPAASGGRKALPEEVQVHDSPVRSTIVQGLWACVLAASSTFDQPGDHTGDRATPGGRAATGGLASALLLRAKRQLTRAVQLF